MAPTSEGETYRFRGRRKGGDRKSNVHSVGVRVVKERGTDSQGTVGNRNISERRTSRIVCQSWITESLSVYYLLSRH